jgi:type IV secretion system protein TrbJ
MSFNALRNRGVALLVAIGLGLAVPKPAHAFYCANCGTEWTQLANNLQLVKQLEQQVAAVQQAIRQYENLLLNTNPLKSQIWSNALGEIKRLNSLFAQAKSLSFASGNLEGLFAKKYGDYQSYICGAIHRR